MNIPVSKTKCITFCSRTMHYVIPDKSPAFLCQHTPCWTLSWQVCTSTAGIDPKTRWAPGLPELPKLKNRLLTFFPNQSQFRFCQKNLILRKSRHECNSSVIVVQKIFSYIKCILMVAISKF